jgi:urease accessory protein
MRRPDGIAWFAAAVLLAWAGTADAHIVAAHLGDFYAGALHPLTDLQDIVLWIAAGLLAGSIGTAQGRWLVLVVPAGLLVGLVAALSFGIGGVGTLANAAMMVVLGLLLAAGIRLRTAPLCATAFGLAMVRGMANAGGLAPETDRLLFAAGLAAVGYIAITLIMALTVAFRGPDAERSASWRGIAIRVCGSWIAAVGLMIGGLALTGTA